MSILLARVAKLVKAPACKTGQRRFESDRVLQFNQPRMHADKR